MIVVDNRDRLEIFQNSLIEHTGKAAFGFIYKTFQTFA